MVVRGQPGTGKTTMLNRLCADWVEGRVPLIDLVFLVNLRSLVDTRYERMGLAEVVTSQFGGVLPETSEEIFRVRQRVCGVCVCGRV